MASKLRAATVVALLVVASGAITSVAAPANVLRITGRTTAYGDITLPATTTFEEITAKINTRGSYAAWWLYPAGAEPKSKSPQAGGVRWAVDPVPPSRPSAIFGRGGRPVPPGRYRLVLATDGETTIEVVGRGLPKSISVAPRIRSTAASGTTELDVLPGGVILDEARQPTHLPSSAMAVVSTLALAKPGVTHRTLTSCITSVARDCDEAMSTSGATVSVTHEHGVIFNAHYYPGEYEPGDSVAVHVVNSYPNSTRAYGYYIWIAVP